jgi:hypothetical protein
VHHLLEHRGDDLPAKADRSMSHPQGLRLAPALEEGVPAETASLNS